MLLPGIGGVVSTNSHPTWKGRSAIWLIKPLELLVGINRKIGQKLT